MQQLYIYNPYYYSFWVLLSTGRAYTLQTINDNANQLL